MFSLQTTSNDFRFGTNYIRAQYLIVKKLCQKTQNFKTEICGKQQRLTVDEHY